MKKLKEFQAWLGHCRYRWRTRNTWWVVTYTSVGPHGSRHSGKFASLELTMKDAISDAEESIRNNASVSGFYRFVVRRPNIIDLFFD
jgi:hypothetical protein